MTSYLGDSQYRPLTPNQRFDLPSHFDRHESQCYEKRAGQGGQSRVGSGVDPATGRSGLDSTSHAFAAGKAQRVDLLLPVRQSSELAFRGYFVDEFHDPLQTRAVRQCNVTFFTADGSLSVYELRTRNSGYTQG